METRIVHLGDEGQLASRQLVARYEAMAASRPELATPALAEGLRALDALDRQYGGSSRLPVEDAEELLEATLREVGRLQQAAGGGADARTAADIAVGVALWGMRHDLPMGTVEPVVNALAMRSNEARGKPELAAVFGLMQGLIAHVRPRLAADLERSNPERPWRILHVNFAITAIRTEDAQMMANAFDALEAALPQEAAGFFAEATALALAPGIAPEVRALIEARHRRHSLP